MFSIPSFLSALLKQWHPACCSQGRNCLKYPQCRRLGSSCKRSCVGMGPHTKRGWRVQVFLHNFVPCRATWAATPASTSPCSLERASRRLSTRLHLTQVDLLLGASSQETAGRSLTLKGYRCLWYRWHHRRQLDKCSGNPAQARVSPHRLDQTWEQPGGSNQGSDGHDLSPARHRTPFQALWGY